jgi:hypothetical protein
LFWIRGCCRLRFDSGLLDLVWHGCSLGESALASICRVGFLSLSSLNNGWYGRGVYFTHHPRYAEYYASKGFSSTAHLTLRGEATLLLSWILVGKVYPAASRMDEEGAVDRAYHGGYPGHDSHYARVAPGVRPCHFSFFSPFTFLFTFFFPVLFFFLSFFFFFFFSYFPLCTPPEREGTKKESKGLLFE